MGVNWGTDFTYLPLFANFQELIQADFRFSITFTSIQRLGFSKKIPPKIVVNFNMESLPLSFEHILLFKKEKGS